MSLSISFIKLDQVFFLYILFIYIYKINHKKISPCALDKTIFDTKNKNKKVRFFVVVVDAGFEKRYKKNWSH